MLPGMPISSFGAVSATTAQPSADALAEEGERHETDDRPFAVDVVAHDRAEREQHAGDDRRLACGRQRKTAPEHAVGDDIHAGSVRRDPEAARAAMRIPLVNSGERQRQAHAADRHGP
jgi:hypothetical protein